MIGSGKSEKRSGPRVDARAPFLLYRGKRLLAKGFTENFSKGGALLTLKAPQPELEVGLGVRLELALPRGLYAKPRSLHCSARIMRVRENGPATLLALEFLKVSTRLSSNAMQFAQYPPGRALRVVSRSKVMGN